MMHPLFSFLFLLGIISTHHVEAKKDIVLTFDDIPLPKTPLMSLETRTERYVQVLNKEQITGVFFAIGVHLEDFDRTGEKSLKKLIKTNQVIANHTYTHMSLSRYEVNDFVEDVVKAHNVLSLYPNYRMWFRFPVLDVGLNVARGGSYSKAIECAKALKELGFRNAYTTIDSFDWCINAMMLQAIREGKKVDINDLERFYLNHLKRAIAKYTAIQTSKNTVQVLLMHANDLNAILLPQIISMLRDSGWTFPVPETAFDDTTNILADLELSILRVKPLMDTGKAPSLYPSIHSREEIEVAFRKEVLHEEV